MPKKAVQKVHINITIDEDLNEWVEKTAGELRMNKSQLINNMISMSKDDMKVLKAMGLLGLAKVVKRVKEGSLTIEKRGLAVRANG